MSADDVVVRLEKVTKVYQQDSIAVHALCGVSLEIHEGDFAVLVGPSGSGKTTLLNVIGGLDTPTAGRIWGAGAGTAGGGVRRRSGSSACRTSRQRTSIPKRAARLWT